MYKATYTQAMRVPLQQVFLYVFCYQLYVHHYLYLFYLLCSLTLFRQFIIFHDCGHNSFTPSTTMNKLLHVVFSILGGVNVDWTNRHKLYHSASGNLSDKNYAWNDTIFFTKQELEQRPRMVQALHKILRFPLIFFPLLSIVIPIRNLCNFRWIPSNVCVFAFTMMFYAGWMTIDYTSLKHVSYAAVITAFYGGVFFHLQHVFNPAYVARGGVWTRKHAALKGSSYVYIPPILDIFTLGIEYHHLHHWNTGIPGYNLKKYCLHRKEFDAIQPLTIGQIGESLACTLYDEKQQQFI